MIIGIGTDIESISKFEKKLNNKYSENFLNKLFTSDELSILKSKAVKSYVGYFCAKEATAKALGTGFSCFSPSDVEIKKLDNGKPYIILHNNAKQVANKMNIKNIHLSISHSTDYATAVVVVED